MNAERDSQHRYLTHFADGGTGMRWYDDPLVEGATLSEGGVVYVVTRVTESRVPSGLGHAWMAPHDAASAE